jgi:hypothetical protein
MEKALEDILIAVGLKERIGDFIAEEMCTRDLARMIFKSGGQMPTAPSKLVMTAGAFARLAAALEKDLAAQK